MYVLFTVLLGVVAGGLMRPSPASSSESHSSQETLCTMKAQNKIIKTFSHGKLFHTMVLQHRHKESSFLDHLKRIGMSSWKTALLKNGCFVPYLLSYSIWISSYYTVFTFLPDKATRLGIEQSKASFLVSIIGVANIGGKLVEVMFISLFIHWTAETLAFSCMTATCCEDVCILKIQYV